MTQERNRLRRVRLGAGPKRLVEDILGAASPVRPKSVVFIPGAQKAGTTTLFGLLRQSNSIAPAVRKEPNFFSSENYLLGLRWYERQFVPNSLSAKYVGLEASTTYAADPYALARLARDLPYSNAVLCIRDPVDRVVSHYHHNVRNGIEDLELSAALQAEDARTASTAEYMLDGIRLRSQGQHHYAYCANSRFGDQIQMMKDLGLDVTVVRLSEISSGNRAWLEGLCERLGIQPPTVQRSSRHLNQGDISELSRANDRQTVLRHKPELLEHSWCSLRDRFDRTMFHTMSEV